MPRAVGRSVSSWRSADAVERPRIAGALTSEGFVLEVESVSEGLARLADESFDLAILDLPDAELQAQAQSDTGRAPAAIRWPRGASCGRSRIWCSSATATRCAPDRRSPARWRRCCRGRCRRSMRCCAPTSSGWRVSARPHARPAGAERPRRHPGRAGRRGAGARCVAGRAGRGSPARSRRSWCWATPSWPRPRARSATRPSPTSPSSAWAPGDNQTPA